MAQQVDIRSRAAWCTCEAVSCKRLGRPKVDEATEDAVRRALQRKNRPGILKIAKELGIGTSTVQRIAAEGAA
jgi:hypothetical protein